MVGSFHFDVVLKLKYLVFTLEANCDYVTGVLLKRTEMKTILSYVIRRITLNGKAILPGCF